MGSKREGKRKEISAMQQNPFSGEERGMEGGQEGQTDGEAPEKKKGRPGVRKRRPFLSPDEKKRSCGKRGMKERMEEREKKTGRD